MAGTKRASTRKKNTQEGSPPKKNKEEEKKTIDGGFQSKAKTKKPRGKKYTVFKLDTGKDMIFTNKKHADGYEQENADIITDTLTFDTEKGFSDYQNTTNMDSPVPKGNIKKEVLSPEERLSLARIKQHRMQNAPTKSISVHFKSTTFSRACVVILEVRDQWGKPQWNFKAKDTMAVLQGYVSDSATVVNGTHTVAIIENLRCIERRDLEKSENTTEKRKGYSQYKLVSYFVIPNSDQITTMEEESIHLKQELQGFARELKRILSSNLFSASLREVISGYSEKLEQMTFAPEKGPTLQTFMQQCTVVVEPIKNFTDHVVKDKQHVVRTFLTDHDEPIPKYISDEQMADVGEGHSEDSADEDEGTAGCAKGFSLPEEGDSETLPE